MYVRMYVRKCGCLYRYELKPRYIQNTKPCRLALKFTFVHDATEDSPLHTGSQVHKRLATADHITASKRFTTLSPTSHSPIINSF